MKKDVLTIRRQPIDLMPRQLQRHGTIGSSEAELEAIWEDLTIFKQQHSNELKTTMPTTNIQIETTIK